MAKQPTSKNGTARIRFIMLDAEIPEGDLSQVTAAIQNALKPATTIIQQRLPSQQAPAALTNGSQDHEVEFEGEPLDDEDEAQPEQSAQRSAREPRVRKPVAMKVLDLDLTSGTSLATFVSSHTPKNDTERNLVALAWFKEHRPDEAVTANHVYTCYRAMKWPSGIDDFAAPLRKLKNQQLVTSPGRGQYAINHLGIARVDKIGAAA